MTHKLLRRLSLKRYLILLTTTLLLAACAGSPGTREPKASGATPGEVQEKVEEISLALPASEYREQFNLAEHSLAQFDWMAATTALADLEELELSPNDSAYASYLRARAAYLRGDRKNALALLDAAGAEELEPAIKYRLNTFHHAIRSMGGEFIDSAHIALDMLHWLPTEEAAAWRRNAWHDLQRASDKDLEVALRHSSDPDWIGWLHLAQDVRTDFGDLNGSLGLWQGQYPDHPAGKPLPGGMAHSFNAAEPNRRVALLLPLSGQLGRAGKAVLDGYLAAYYSARERQAVPASLQILDVANFTSVTDAYNTAATAGAQMIVGPLSKTAVAELALLPNRPVPILALNRVDNVPPATGSALVQFSLSPEDEAETLADSAFGRGARSAIILAPAGTWGEKVDRALRQRWQALGGRVVSGAAYSDQDGLSQSVQEALGLAASEARARRVRDMLAINVEFTARRRHDPDIIFLLSRNAAEARALKPLLSFHYAGELPVYALPSIYSGTPENRNRDLNGTNLVEMPWLLGAQAELKKSLTAANVSAGYTRLHALGVDAYLLASNFARLASGADALFRGTTGLLRMDPELRIRRELSLATFDGGGVRPQ